MNEKEEVKRLIAMIENWASYIGEAFGKILRYLLKHQEQVEEDIDNLYDELERMKKNPAHKE